MVLTRNQTRRLLQEQQTFKDDDALKQEEIELNDILEKLKQIQPYYIESPFANIEDVVSTLQKLISVFQHVPTLNDKFALLDQIFRILAINFQTLIHRDLPYSVKRLCQVLLLKLKEGHEKGWKNAVVYQQILFPSTNISSISS